MPTRYNNLIRFLTTLYLKHQIIGMTIRYELSLNYQMNHNLLSPILHPSKHLWVLNCNSSTGDLRVGGVIFHVPSVDGIDTIRGDWTHKHSLGTIFGSDGGAVDTILHWVWVVDPFLVEEHYLTRNVVLSLLKLVEIVNNENWGLDVAALGNIITLRLNRLRLSRRVL